MGRLTLNRYGVTILKMITYQELRDRFDVAERNARALPVRTRRDCMRMAEHVRELFQLASQAEITCRRLRKITSEYERSLIQIEASLQNFEGYVIMAKLMKGPK